MVLEPLLSVLVLKLVVVLGSDPVRLCSFHRFNGSRRLRRDKPAGFGLEVSGPDDIVYALGAPHQGGAVGEQHTNLDFVLRVQRDLTDWKR